MHSRVERILDMSNPLQFGICDAFQPQVSKRMFRASSDIEPRSWSPQLHLSSGWAVNSQASGVWVGFSYLFGAYVRSLIKLLVVERKVVVPWN